MNISLASLFNLAGPDLIIILLIVLLLFGAKKLPELARGMGQAMKEFNKAKDEFDKELHKPLEDSVVIKTPKDKEEHRPSQPESASASVPQSSSSSSEPKSVS
jgi:sec-independent protein translocase protein TatA